jgi:hypothetical protein
MLDQMTVKGTNRQRASLPKRSRTTNSLGIPHLPCCAITLAALRSPATATRTPGPSPSLGSSSKSRRRSCLTLQNSSSGPWKLFKVKSEAKRLAVESGVQALRHGMSIDWRWIFKAGLPGPTGGPGESDTKCHLGAHFLPPCGVLEYTLALETAYYQHIEWGS